MSESEGGGGVNVDFLSTHPANAKRIKVSLLICNHNHASGSGFPTMGSMTFPPCFSVNLDVGI